MKLNYLLLLALVSLMGLWSCSEDEDVYISEGEKIIGKGITSDTLSGAVKGTLVAGNTYYFKSDIIVNAGDTLLMQSGAKLIAIGDGTTTAKSPQITVNGTFMSLGTKDKQNYITVIDSYRDPANAFKGYWGGIQCGSKSGDLIIKWTHIEFVGGPSGPANDPAIYSEGSARYTILFSSESSNFVLEDSWIYGSKDDAIRCVGGKMSIMRNTFEMCGEKGGESFNVKSGAVGDIAYNLFIGAATNGAKLSNSGGSKIQCNVNIYNNTFVNCGMRQVKTGRGGSINTEAGAKGLIYNNLIVNCRFGLRVVVDTDTLNTKYNNQFYYGNDDAFVKEFNATAGISKPQKGDIYGKAKENDPLFVAYDVKKYDFTQSPLKAPADVYKQPYELNQVGTSNFRLQPTSGAIGKGKTDFSPVKAVTKTGVYGTDITLPGKDIGAYQADGSGNQH
ncbi:MAG: right-handed parallel beta-helix repeat-containing protein [Spirosomataceae bacterium]